jgi:hypothetical protein
MLTYACADGAAGLGSLAHSAAGVLSQAPPDDIGDNRRAAGSRPYTCCLVTSQLKASSTSSLRPHTLVAENIGDTRRAAGSRGGPLACR